jgi:two-component system response regulator DevR
VPITVLLSDDKEVIRKSIRILLDSDPEIQLVGEAVNFKQTLQSAIDLRPQVVVMDLHMPDAPSVSPQKIKSVLSMLGSQLVAISFSFDQEALALAQSLGAVLLLDKMVLATELIPAIKAAAKQRNPGSSW